MNVTDFRRILTSFADNPADVDFGKGRLLVQLRDELVAVEVEQREGDVWVRENEVWTSGYRWIVERVARVPQLADRIQTYAENTEHFVTPAAELIDELEAAPEDSPKKVNDAASCLLEVLGRRPAGATSILYLTSDAGEGKTTLINHAARRQALEFRAKRASWLLVPISLGGRPFLRFDDVVIGALVNRFRFQNFFYDAFLELVRLGVLVPAFDGFEEIFITSSSGEALSALGGLVSNLSSSGSVLISARKAYFEYQTFATRARLFDAVGRDVVSFARLSLQRWSRSKFLEYASKRNFPHAVELYQKVEARLGPAHPVLSRAVLVKRLIDVASDGRTLEVLLSDFGSAPQDYFYQFVNAIIEREVQEKWIDRSGEHAQPLLTVQEHHELLALVAQEMWLTSTEAMRVELLDLVADLFSESKRKNPMISRQIRERLKQHSLISQADAARSHFAFDHEDFRQFFLGQALGRALVGGGISDLVSFCRVGALSRHTAEAAVRAVLRADSPLPDVVRRLLQVARMDAPTSFTRENAGALMVQVLSDGKITGETVADLTFPPDSLRGSSISDTRFVDCYFQATTLNGAHLENVEFVRCKFDEISVSESMHAVRVTFDDTEVVSVEDEKLESRIFNPAEVAWLLTSRGFSIRSSSAKASEQGVESQTPDEETLVMERGLRLFLRATQVNQETFRVRLGKSANLFLKDILPQLEKAGIIEEVLYAGAGKGRRFRLSVQMQRIDAALTSARGDFRQFLKAFGQ
jgi:hypothetical protein